MAHKCQKHVEGRPQRFGKYLADLLALVDVGLLRECESQILNVVDDFIDRSKKPSVE